MRNKEKKKEERKIKENCDKNKMTGGSYRGHTKEVHSSFLHFNKTFAGNINPLMIPVLSECGRTVVNTCRERFK
jgi:hypothetical protein